MVRKILLTIASGLLCLLLYIAFFYFYKEIAFGVLPAGHFSFSTVSWDEGLFSADGTWKLLRSSTPGDSISVNKCIIECDKQEGACSVYTAQILDAGNKFLELSNERFLIKEWSKRRIVAIDEDFRAFGRSILTVYRKDKIVEIKQEQFRVPDNFAQPNYDPKFISRLVDGFSDFYESEDNKLHSFVWFSLLILFMLYLYCLYRIWRNSFSKRDVD